MSLILLGKFIHRELVVLCSFLLNLDCTDQGAHTTTRLPVPAFLKTEEQARIEESITGNQPALDRELVLALPNGAASEPDEESFFGRTREFDWGD